MTKLIVLIALAQSPIPDKHIPGTVLLELRSLSNQFDTALSRDCAPEKCISKGCVYTDHVVVDLPKSTSLPGLPNEQGIGAVPAQEYLTAARCEFAHEKSVAPKDVQALSRRLEQELSKGWLRVSVAHQALEPVPADLSVSPPFLPQPDALKADAVPAVPPKAPEWEAAVALRELWVTLLPHFFWMVGVMLGTLAILFIIWGLRRLGRETLEEKAMLKELENAQPVSPDEADTGETEVPADVQVPAGPDPFVEQQQQEWLNRIAKSGHGGEKNGVDELLRSWLSSRDFALLAKATLVFGDKLNLNFPSDGDLAALKVEFAEYLKDLDATKLPPDPEFFRKLNQHAISSSLLAQADAEIYRSLREEFGSSGSAHLIERLPARSGALLFALLPTDAQQEVARLLSAPQRLQVSGELLKSNRITRQDRDHLFETLDAARAGKPFSAPPKPMAHEISDRGRELDAAGALSVLFQHIDTEDRRALFGHALEQFGGTYPLWYENILFPDMLMKLPAEVRSDMLLEVDIRGLAGWSSVQQPKWQESFVGQLPASLQAAVRANMGFASRAAQLQQAQKGHDELVGAMKRLVARGKVSFSQMVA
jgi:hypothetical protein